MKLGCVSDSLSALSLTDMLDMAVRLGLSGVELNTGGWSATPHFDLPLMLGDANARRAYMAEFSARGLDIVALNVNGNPLHPTDRGQGDALIDTIRVAGEMGVRKVCTMSGLPAGSADDHTPNWVTSAWPPENLQTLQYQWDDCLVPFWIGVTQTARDAGIEQIALELHAHQCVHNVPSLMALREAVGPVIGANLDPSHLFWMGADPIAAAGALGEAIYHVHASDCLINAAQKAVGGLLETRARMDVAGRSWSYTSPGIGHGTQWWRQFCYELRMTGYDGWVMVEHEDVMIDPLEGLTRSADFLRAAMPVAEPSFQLPSF